MDGQTFGLAIDLEHTRICISQVKQVNPRLARRAALSSGAAVAAAEESAHRQMIDSYRLSL